MPSLEHELLVALLRAHPQLLLDLLGAAFGRSAEGYVDVLTASENLTEIEPPERRADLVLLIRPSPEHAPTAAWVVEVQLRPDPRKHYAWPVYVAVLRARLRCAVSLVVLALDESTAAWCRRPISLDDAGSVVRPIVIGPGQVAFVDIDRARRQPELALVATLAHRAQPTALAQARTLLRALDDVDDARAAWYADIVLELAGDAVRAALEAEMIPEGREFRSEFMRRIVAESEARGIAAGEARGQADGARAAIGAAIVKVLEARGIPVSPEHHSRIAECTDRETLDAWLVRAVSVADADALFDG